MKKGTQLRGAMQKDFTVENLSGKKGAGSCLAGGRGEGEVSRGRLLWEVTQVGRLEVKTQ